MDRMWCGPRSWGRHMRRREFITLLGSGAVACPLAARAQQPTPTVPQVRVGILSASPPTPAMLNAFREGMRERGYTEGQNLSIDVRWPQGTFEQDPAIAATAVSLSDRPNQGRHPGVASPAWRGVPLSFRL